MPRSPSSEAELPNALTPGRVGAEAHHLDRGDDDEVDAAEDRGAEDGARDVPARVGRLLAEGGRRLEAGEGQEPEHHAEEQRWRRRCPAARLNTLEREADGRPGRVAADQPDEHDRGHDQDQRDGGALDGQQHAVPRLAGEMVSTSATTSARPTSRNGAQVGGCCQMPIAVRNAAPKMPAADEVTTP